MVWGRSRSCARRGQQDRRLALAGAVHGGRVEGLLRDKTRPPGTPRLGDAVAERVVALTLGEPPSESTHWTGRLMAKVAGVGLTSVQRIWKAHGLAPHRIRTFKLSNDPKFAAKVRDIVGLYVDPPAHAVVHAATQLVTRRQMNWAPAATPLVTPRQLAGRPARRDLAGVRLPAPARACAWTRRPVGYGGWC
jgi:hypothetical protein